MILGLIPARGGSKGIPRKNIKPLGGKPLIQWTIEAARESGVIDRLVVSTEDEEIASVTQHLGVEVLTRPSELAKDDTPMNWVVEHALHAIAPDYVVLLQPTTPFRSAETVRRAVHQLKHGHPDQLVSVSPVPMKYAPELLLFVEEHGCIVNAAGRAAPPLRQLCRPGFVRDGAIYAFDTGFFNGSGMVFDLDRTCGALLTPAGEGLNLDEPEDWEEAERRVASMRQLSEVS